MANVLIREEAKKRNVKHWQIAEELGISEITFCRKLRHELSAGDTDRVLKAIERIAERKGQS